MIRKLLLAAVLLFALPLVVGNAGAAACTPWNAASPAQHHKVFNTVDVVGGHGYGSGYHDAAHRSPPTPLGAYGDPQRRAGEGGYVQIQKGVLIIQVNAFGPSDENDTTHLYDTVLGYCVSYNQTGRSLEKCVATSNNAKRPTAWGTWTPCGGY
jgi:hypothetical protein